VRDGKQPENGVDAPQVPRVDDPAYPALEPYDSYERFFLGEYRGVVELA
jgi:hypothetical protein